MNTEDRKAHIKRILESKIEPQHGVVNDIRRVFFSIPTKDNPLHKIIEYVVEEEGLENLGDIIIRILKGGDKQPYNFAIHYELESSRRQERGTGEKYRFEAQKITDDFENGMKKFAEENDSFEKWKEKFKSCVHRFEKEFDKDVGECQRCSKCQVVTRIEKVEL